jgi:hypothetical protein
MKLSLKTIVFLIVVTCSAVAGAQQRLSLQQMKQKTDSILAEADLLYRFEKAAWIASDSARVRSGLTGNLGPYMVYQSSDSVRVVFLNRALNACVYEAIFLPLVDTPFSQKAVIRKLTPEEDRLFDARRKILLGITDKNYQVSCPDGYNLNIELFPVPGGYKFYLLTGTGQNGVIPFGNDYMFMADEKGKVLSLRKFHTRLISQPVAYEGEKVVKMVHSHIRNEPFISATDICTFRLYGSYYGFDSFSVYSPAFSLYFIYKMASNTIEIDRDDSQ